jgi:hypothetical protein
VGVPLARTVTPRPELLKLYAKMLRVRLKRIQKSAAIPRLDEIRAFDTMTREPKECSRLGGSGEKISGDMIMDLVKEKANERIEAR